jgi:hypothetical protein
METEASAMNCISINPDHQLICVGTTAGRIEAWDPRYFTYYNVQYCIFILLFLGFLVCYILVTLDMNGGTPIAEL